MAMLAPYLNAIRDHGQSIITHLGLVNGSGVEIASGSYARVALADIGGWTDDGDGVSRPGGNAVFNMTAGDVVAGWRGYSAPTGGTNYGGGDLTSATFSLNGTYTLLAASTSITHAAS